MFTRNFCIAVVASLWAFAAQADDVATAIDRDVNAALAMEACDQRTRVQDEQKCGRQHRAADHKKGTI